MRRERFVEELESYSKQLEEFQTFGDMPEVPRYLKKAQALHQRLESAAEKVHILTFNLTVDLGLLKYETSIGTTFDGNFEIC